MDWTWEIGEGFVVMSKICTWWLYISSTLVEDHVHARWSYTHANRPEMNNALLSTYNLVLYSFTNQFPVSFADRMSLSNLLQVLCFEQGDLLEDFQRSLPSLSHSPVLFSCSPGKFSSDSSSFFQSRSLHQIFWVMSGNEILHCLHLGELLKN